MKDPYSTAQRQGQVLRCAQDDDVMLVTGITNPQRSRDSASWRGLRTVLFELLAGAAQPVTRDGREPALLRWRLEAQPPAIETRHQHRTITGQNPAIEPSTAISLQRLRGWRATFTRAALLEPRDDVPRLPFRAARILEISISHLRSRDEVRPSTAEFALSDLSGDKQRTPSAKVLHQSDRIRASSATVDP